MTNNRRFTEYDRLIESCEIVSRVGGRGRRLLRLVSMAETGETRDQRVGEGVVEKKLQRGSRCRGTGSSSEKTRFCRILNDSLTHQTTPFSFARNYVNSS